MAIYHLNVKIISKKHGHSIIAAAAYRSGKRLQDTNTGKIYNYSRKQDVVHSTILAPAHTPQWVYDCELLWNQVNRVENRRDAQLARDITLALPKELSLVQQIKLVEEFCNSDFIVQGMIANINIHHDNPNNPHAHILLTMRDINERGFVEKNRTWNDKKLLISWRANWSKLINDHLSANGYPMIQIDHRTLEEQGIDRKPQIHLGKQAMHATKKGKVSKRYQKNEAIKQENNGQKAVNKPSHQNTQNRYGLFTPIVKVKPIPEPVSPANEQEQIYGFYK